MSKRKSYTADFKLKVIDFAETNGNRAAGREYNVDETFIRDWKKLKTSLKYMNRNKRANRGKIAQWPELEELKNWIVERRRVEKRQVSTITQSHKSHLTLEIQILVKSHSQLAVIPGGLTKKLQPLDLTVNRSFKCKLRQKWEDWMLNGLKSYTKTNKIRKASYEEVCNWVLESWTEVTSKCIQNGFKSAELYSYENINNEDDDITIIDDQQSDDNDEEFDQIMDKFKLLFKSFNTESDEEFDGFD
jgi:transposase-like protein